MDKLISIMPIIIDVVAVFIFLVVIYKSYRMGFMRAVVLLIGYAASVVAAFYLSTMLTDWLYNEFIRQRIITSIDEIIRNSSNATIASVVPFVLDMLPQIFFRPMIVNSFGGESGIITIIEEQTSGAIETLSLVITELIIAPLLTFAMNVLICLLIFTICIIIVKAIARLFTRIYAIPILGPINSLLGGLMGLLKAPIVLVIIGAVVSLFCTVTSNKVLWLNNELIEQTLIFKHFMFLFSN